MTTAQYPAYDGSADASAWWYGLGTAFLNGGVYVGLGGTDAVWGCWTMPLSLQPGTYYLTELGIVAGCLLATDADAARFAIFEDSSGTLTPIAFDDGSTYIDMTAEITVADGSSQDIGPTTVASVPFTIESGKSYQMGFGISGVAGRTADKPGVMLMANATQPQGLLCYSTGALASFPVAHTGTVNSTGEVPRGYIKFTTAVRTLYSGSYAAAGSMLIPRRTDGDYCIKFRSAVVEAGEALTVLGATDASGSSATKWTLVLDMGATDQITFGAANVALNAVTPEAGDSFDMMVEYRADNKGDLFFLNKTVGQGPEGAADFATISHAVKNGSARAAEYTFVAAPQFLVCSGTAAVATIQVGWEPVVMFGDSQCSRAGESTMSSSDRLAKYVPEAFTHQRIYWLAGIGGNRFAATSGGSYSAGYLRYKSTTAGQGDLCEMTSPLFVFGGMGINDISAVVGGAAPPDTGDETARNGIVMLMAYRLAEILDDLQDRGVRALIIGMPPYSSSVSASAAEAQCVQQWNITLEGLACGARAAYVNPWHSVVENPGASVPTFSATYSEGAGGLHYNGAGAALIAAKCASSVESGIIGGWWSQPRRRWNRSQGSLVPF